MNVSKISVPEAQAVTGVIVVDLQGDFTTLKQGALAVEGSDRAYVEKVKQVTLSLKEKGFTLFATQDWHPRDHVSFFTSHPGKQPFETIEIDGISQLLWPPHCVKESENARLLMDVSLFFKVVKKGTNRLYDSYSGFQDQGGAPTELERLIRDAGLTRLIIYGLATDYCVKATALDAAKRGFEVFVVKNLSRGVSMDTTGASLEEMGQHGINIITMKELQSTT
ncbi:MAG: isochorismatase family protein [Desulfobacterium sp.]|jgi:nicotinamidase/pyrazinamidase|nr:isochorismatase family protein [Desulfobacterium sp.]